MSSRESGRADRTGITHFPIEEERNSRQRVPPGSRKAEAEESQGHRLSRRAGPQKLITDSERSFEGKGGKGGKSRGSRAGLLSASRKTKR